MIGLWVLLLTVGWGATSCSTLPQPSDQPVRKATADQLLDRLRANEEAIGSLKALFRANVQGEGVPVAYRVDGVFLYHRPQTIRLKAFSRFGGVVFDFLLDRQHYSLHFPDKRQVYTGLVTELGKQKDITMPVQLSLYAFDAMLGRVVDNTDQPVEFVEDGDRYRFDVSSLPFQDPSNGQGVVRRVWIDRRHLQVNQLEYLLPTGEATHVVQAKDFRRVRDVSPVQSRTIVLPFQIEAEDRVGKGSVSLNFQEMVANSPLGPQEFGLRRF